MLLLCFIIGTDWYPFLEREFFNNPDLKIIFFCRNWILFRARCIEQNVFEVYLNISRSEPNTRTSIGGGAPDPFLRELVVFFNSARSFNFHKRLSHRSKKTNNCVDDLSLSFGFSIRYHIPKAPRSTTYKTHYLISAK